MRIRPGHLLFALGLACTTILGSGCSSLGGSRSAASVPLRIGTVTDTPPLAFRQKGRWAGVEIDLGRALAKRLGMVPVFVACSPDRLASALLDGRVDMLMAGMSITDERRVRMDFSSPYLVVGQAALVRSADLMRYNTEIKIRSTSARVGVVEGSTGAQWVRTYFSNADCIVFPHAEEAVAALLQNQIDLLVHDVPALWWLALSHEPKLAVAPTLFAREEIAWAFRRGSVALREAANQALTDWQKDGTLAAILHRWIPFSQ